MNNKSERMYQSSNTGLIVPKVKIENTSSNPVGSLFSVWHGSKNATDIPSEVAQLIYQGDLVESIYYKILEDSYEDLIEKYKDVYDSDKYKAYSLIVLEIAKLNLKSDLPSGECLLFTIKIDDATIAWREQVARSKVSSIWVQSSRIFDLTTMDVAVNPSMRLLGGDEAVDIMEKSAGILRIAYQSIIDLGVPMEDIRLIPQAATHRVYWMINARSLIKILNKRSNWILQATLWSPIISGIVDNLRSLGLYELFQDFLGNPMCDVVDGKIVNYKLELDNEDRLSGKDKLPPDPLYLASKDMQVPDTVDKDYYNFLKSMFIRIWSDEYLKVLGWDRNDPSKIGYYEDFLR